MQYMLNIVVAVVALVAILAVCYTVWFGIVYLEYGIIPEVKW